MVVAGLISAHADAEIEGKVCAVNQKKMGIRITEENTCLKAVFLNSIAQADFRALKVGDYISAAGTQNVTNGKVEVESVHAVGLQRLIGTWKDSKYRVVTFQSFNSFSRQDASGAGKPELFDYELYPNGSNGWLMLLSSGAGVWNATLRDAKDKTYELCIYTPSDVATANYTSDCSTLTR